jgi:acetyltransferase-like isoleucine patch superfamily enzyme
MSVVTKDVPEFSVAMGQPARVVKKVEAVSEEVVEGE